MAIQDHLTSEENIIKQNGIYYATEKRVIRYENKRGREDLSDLAYSFISSVNLVSDWKYEHPKLKRFGIGIIVLGIIIFAIPVLVAIPVPGIDKNIVDGPVEMLAAIIGIIIIIVGIIYRHKGLEKEAIYKFIVPGILGNESKKWKIYSDSNEATEFVKTVREHLKEL